MTYHEIKDALYEDEKGWTLGVEGEELLRWLLKNFRIYPKNTVENIKPPPPSKPAPENITYNGRTHRPIEKYDYYKDRWLW